ncbi:MAG TPA: M20/M25/M40 family metallo-hydrolase [Vicinamibacterales bacterium]|nr:M20/M25/M40 family metallo-hydrolase [Vicinamibacterales bacterium]
MNVMYRRQARLAAAAIAMAAMLAPVSAQQDRNDYDAIYRIKQEGFQQSQVMDIESWLTDVYGPRLTNSPNYKKAGDWAVKELTGWGLANVHKETWGPFGRGWSNDKFYAQALTPTPFPIIGYPLAWSAGTHGLVSGDAVIADIQTEDDFAKYKGQLKGKFVFVSPLREVEAHFTPDAHRYTDEELAEMQKDTSVMPRGRFGGPGRRGGPAAGPRPTRAQIMAFNAKRMQFFEQEGAVALITDGRGDDGTVFVQSAPGVSRDPGTNPGLPQIAFAVEHYGRLYRAMEKKQPVKLELDVKNTFYDDDPNTFNIVAEIPGTDKADEVVMLGAHFDSWQTATGATDNAAGSAVMMEAMRILKESGLKMRRTVRLALWGGEEEGLLGSRAYVKAHFGDPQTMQVTPEQAKIAGYYNVDNGTGAIRGVYLQGNGAVAPIFDEWMKPFHSLGMQTLTIRNTGGTDHLSFDAVGIPGFQFIQDPIDYGTRTHHSNMDAYERIQEPDMRQNAVIVAAFVYNTANRDEMLPRKPMPKPRSGAGFGS